MVGLVLHWFGVADFKGAVDFHLNEWIPSYASLRYFMLWNVMNVRVISSLLCGAFFGGAGLLARDLYCLSKLNCCYYYIEYPLVFNLRFLFFYMAGWLSSMPSAFFLNNN
ncbi:hypothetical protein OUZ56_020866 [Daphnia magna]|uniref:Uncharacterized protein n=1 Tax=Daphnia magna TaxID=35525 RepID=A0ABQ9ZFN8_9CRUS|nr:hypothetical protein OUZ56_020866 [Daphnia magna]